MALVKETLGIHAAKAAPAELNFSRSTSGTRVNNIGHIELVEANKIRHDFSPTIVGKVIGWLLEESSTNSALQSEDFSTTWTTTTIGNIGNNTTKAPDATNNADTLSASSSATGTVAVKQQGLTFTSGTSYTVSVFAKKKDLDYVEISNKADASAGMTFAQTFNLATGATGASGGTITSAEMQQFPHGWYRCQVTFEANASSNTEVFVKTRSDNAVSTDFAATNGHGIYIWGAQVEPKLYATSYIPTTTAPVVRAADVAYVDNTEARWNMDVGTSILVDATPLNTTEVVSPIYHYQDADNSDYITHLSNGKVAIVAGGSSQLDTNPFDAGPAFATTKKTNFRSMMAVGTNGRYHATKNGSLSTTLPKTGVTVPVNNLQTDYTVKFFHGTGLTSGSGWLKQFKIFSNVVTDLELQNLSLRTNVDAQSLQINALNVIDGSISEIKLADDSVTSAKIVDGTIVAADMADDAVTADKLAANSVVNESIVDGTILGPKIAANSITSAHLGLDVIVAEDIAANAITVSELQDGAVTKPKLADNSVDIAKLDVTDSGNAGDVLKTDGAGNLGFTNPSSQAVGGDLSGTIGNAQINADTIGLNELTTANAGTTGQLLSKNALGVLEFTDSANVAATNLGGDLTGTIADAQIAGGAVGTPELANDSVDIDKLAANSVVSDNIVNGTIVAVDMADDAITDAKLSDHATLDSGRAVGTNHIKDSAVTNDKIANGTISASKLAAGTLTGTTIGTGTITSANIMDDTIATVDLGEDVVDARVLADNPTNDASRAVTSDHIRIGAIIEEKLSHGAATEHKIGNLAISNQKLQTNCITTSKIADNQITIDKLAVTDGTAGQVLSTDGNGVLSFTTDSTNVGGTAVGGDVTGTVSNITIPTGAITSDMLGVDVIVAEDIAANAITVSELQNNAVTRDKIVADAVDGSKIADNSIDSEHYVDGSIDAEHLAPGIIIDTHMAANSINGTHIQMGSDAQGDTLYYDGANYVRLAKGAAGQVLKMNPGGTIPSWADDVDTTIGDAAVGGDVTGTISNITIPANSITSSQLAAGAIIAQDIAANQVDGTHIAMGGDTAGDTLYYNGTDYVRLPAGTAGQVLKMNTGANAPEWAADTDTTIGDAAVGGDVTGTISNIQIGADAVGMTELSTVNAGTTGQILSKNANGLLEFVDDATSSGGNSGGMVSGPLNNISINAGVVTPTMLAASGTASSSTFLRGDGQWATVTAVEVDPTAVTMAIALG